MILLIKNADCEQHMRETLNGIKSNKNRRYTNNGDLNAPLELNNELYWRQNWGEQHLTIWRSFFFSKAAITKEIIIEFKFRN